jgi:plastocyanin
MSRTIIRSVVLSAAVTATAIVVPALPAGAGGGGCREQQLVDRHATEIEAKDFCFFPMVVRVGVNQSVRVTNRDEAEHTVSGVGGWGEDLASPGAAVSLRFPVRGTYPFFCQYHPGMMGVIVVGSGLPSLDTVHARPVLEVASLGTPTTAYAAPSAPPSDAAADPAPSLASAHPSAAHHRPRLAVDVAILVPLALAAYGAGRLRRRRA